MMYKFKSCITCANIYLNEHGENNCGYAYCAGYDYDGWKPRTCQNCVNWERINDKSVFGECNCDNFVYTGKIDPPVKNDILTYWDCECYSAGFETGENFGCVHFKGYSDEPY